jgi:DNA modification methylase
MYQLLQGDVLSCLSTLPYQSVHCVVTSPPYFGLRDYGHTGQIGLESSPLEFVERLVEVFREVRRVLRDDGTLWLNLGDSYAGAGYANHKINGQEWYDNANLDKRTDRQQSLKKACQVEGIKPKDLVGIPWRVAFALQADGWYLRSDIIWHKPNPMPESVTDRPTKSHEYLFLLTKSPRYFYDAEAIKEPCSDAMYRQVKDGYNGKGTKDYAGAGVQNPSSVKSRIIAKARQLGGILTRNKRSVWTITTQSFKGAHFAVFPEKLVEPCVLAGTSEVGVCIACGAPWVRVVQKTGGRDWHKDRMIEGVLPGDVAGEGGNKRGRSHEPLGSSCSSTVDWRATCDCPFDDPTAATVLDPFAGSATTGVVALKHGRNFIGIELNPEYAALAKQRLDTSVPPSVF